MKRFTFILSLFAFLSIAASARQVNGSVICGKQALSGVVVTDGTHFTQTGKNGRFTFDINDDAYFVYIITPAGYAADWTSGVPAFYQKAQGKKNFVFDLKKLGESDDYHILAVGDPQPRSDAHFEEFSGVPLDDLSATSASLEGITIGVALGDVCYDVLPLQKRWKEVITRTGIPFYTAVGNHDHDKQYPDDKNSIMAYRENLGPENYAVFIGNDIMIVLDNIIYNGRRSYKEGYTDEILDWVENLMAYVPADADIYVAQHSPLNGRNNQKMIINHQRMLDIVKGHKVTFMSGHNHISGYYEYAENVSEHSVAAICGTWWETYHCTDGTPRGYKVFTMDKGHLSWYYKSVGRDKTFQFELFRPGECRLNKDCVVVNVWDYDPCWRIEWYQDGEYQGLMQQVEEYSPLHAADIYAKYEAVGKKPAIHKCTRAVRHFFAAKPAEGASEVTVKVTDRFGNVITEKLSLK